MSGSILIIDDEQGQREILAAILKRADYTTNLVAGGKEALRHLENHEYDLILTDLKMEGMSGMELLTTILGRNPQQCVIMMTAHGSVDSAVQAMKFGAFDYLEKPLERDQLLLVIRRAFERLSLYRENVFLRRQLAETASVPNIIGEHSSMREVFRIITKIAPSTSTVLISGESGTGKELVARALHDLSPRREKNFLAINCAAIPESLMESELFGHEKGAFTGANNREIGMFEAAEGGTVFLDEIGEMNLTLQAKLLRVIQEKEIRRVGGKVSVPVDVRIVSATNRELEQEIRRGSFREDLFYRLNVIRLHLPPLRERGNDLVILAEHFVRTYGSANGRTVTGITAAALRKLAGYSWPGNVRQLESVIERCVLLADKPMIDVDDLPAEILTPAILTSATFELPPEGISLEELEQQLMEQAMHRANGVISRAAPLLGMSYKTLQYRLDKFGLNRNAAKAKE